MKIYYAAPLFNEEELEKNSKMKKILEKEGFEVMLPQEESGLAYDEINENNKYEIYKKIFDGDVEDIKRCDVLVFDLNGRVPDEGGCVELGIAYAYGKKCVGFKTDTRAIDKTGDDNLMIEGCMNFNVTRSIEELINTLKNL